MVPEPAVGHTGTVTVISDWQLISLTLVLSQLVRLSIPQGCWLRSPILTELAMRPRDPNLGPNPSMPLASSSVTRLFLPHGSAHQLPECWVTSVT